MKTALVVVVVLIVASIAGVFGKKIANWINGDPLEAAMQDAVNAMRPTLPRKIDDLTTLVSVDLLRTTMMYHYRMNDTSKVDKKVFESRMQSKLIKDVCGSPMIKTINPARSTGTHTRIPRFGGAFRCQPERVACLAALPSDPQADGDARPRSRPDNLPGAFRCHRLYFEEQASAN